MTITINEFTSPEDVVLDVLPCPFCGGQAKLFDTGYGHYGVSCKQCHASIKNDLIALPVAKARDDRNVQDLIDRYGIDPFFMEGAVYTKDIHRINAVEKWNRRNHNG